MILVISLTPNDCIKAYHAKPQGAQKQLWKMFSGTYSLSLFLSYRAV